MGHSIGGVAAAHALVDVNAIKSGINIDGHFESLPFDESHLPSKPFMWIEAHGTPSSDETREEFDEGVRSMLKRQAAVWRNNTGDAYRVTIDGADHLSFHDSIFLTSQDSGYAGADPVKVAMATRTYLLAFFRKTLADDKFEFHRHACTQ